MSIYVKALDYQTKTYTLYADPVSAEHATALENSKKTLKAAFQNLLGKPNSADLIVLALKMVPPSEKARKKYIEWIKEEEKSTRVPLFAQIQAISEKNNLNVPVKELSQVMELVFAEHKMIGVVNAMPAQYQAYRASKKEYKQATLTALKEGKTKEQILAEMKSEAYKINDHSLNFRALDKIQEWAQKI